MFSQGKKFEPNQPKKKNNKNSPCDLICFIEYI